MTVKFATAKDITPNRCTIVGVFGSDDEARASLDGADDTWCVFEVAEGESVKPGDRAYVGGLTGTVWA